MKTADFVRGKLVDGGTYIRNDGHITSPVLLGHSPDHGPYYLADGYKYDEYGTLFGLSPDHPATIKDIAPSEENTEEIENNCSGASYSTSDDYFPLQMVLNEAYQQAATGKGRERHANDKPFDRQPLLETTRVVGVGFPLGQAMKKAGESAGMMSRGETDKAVHECLGAIVYLAAAVIAMRESKKSD